MSDIIPTINPGVIPTDGMRPIEPLAPANGTDFTLEELQKIVGGYIEVVRLDDGAIMIINEEGKLHGLPPNERATRIAHAAHAVAYSDEIVGPVAIIKDDQLR